MRKAHNETSTEETAETVRKALVNLRRMLQRRDLVRLWGAAVGARKNASGTSVESGMDYAELRLLDAVRVAQEHKPSEGVAVGEIALLLGIDPSRASRQVARSVSKGFLQRHAEQGDGRKVILQVTPRGAKLQGQGSELTRARIEFALADWSKKDREQFALLFTRFAKGMSEL